MLIISTPPNSAYLLHLAIYLLQKKPSKVKEATKLVTMAGRSTPTLQLRLRIANILATKNKIVDAKKMISEIDPERLLKEITNSYTIKLFLDTLVTLDQIEHASYLFEKAHTLDRITSSDGIEIRLKIANSLVNKGDYEKAKTLLDEVNVASAYYENLALKNVNARIGWILYWPKKEYTKVIDWIEKDLSDINKDYKIPRFDISSSRLSGEWRLNYAQVLAAIGNIEKAEAQVKIAYSTYQL
jgi:tetratricopeptide (TPR) repeat protein